MKHIPNALTILRILLVPIFIVLMASPGVKYSIHLALAVFIFAAGTDWLDGYIARRMSLISDFGKIADPLADKMLVLSALAILTWASPFGLSKAIFVIILLREVVITVMREVYQRCGIVVPADNLGKLKTLMQMTGLIVALSLWAVLPEMPSALVIVMNIWWWLTALVTLISGLNYLICKRR